MESSAPQFHPTRVSAASGRGVPGAQCRPDVPLEAEVSKTSAGYHARTEEMRPRVARGE